MTNEEHEAAALAAERSLAEVHEQIAAAKREEAETTPAAAVRSGMPLAQAGARFAAAQLQIGFLLDAADHAAVALRTAQLARDAALVEEKYRPRFKAAVAKRLAAIKVHEAAKLALEASEVDYEDANRVIEDALAHGLDKPPHLRENPLRLPWMIDHATKVRLPLAASEAALWNQYL